MADEGLRFEAYSMPHVGALTRKFDFSKWVEAYVLNDRFNDLSDGRLSMPDDFPLKDSLFFVDEDDHTNDVGSMVRVLRGSTPIMHYLVTRSEDSWSDGEPTHKLSLEGLEWILDRVLVPNYDHPADPTKEPDWIYGAPSILANTDLEDAGTSNFRIHLWLEDGVSAGTWNIEFDDGTPDDVTLDWNDDITAVQTGIEGLANVDDIIISGAGTETNPWIIEVVDPAGTDYNVTIDSSGLTGGSALHLAQNQGGVGVTDPWTRSFNPLTGLFHGTYTNFQISTAQAHSGTSSLYVKGALGAWADSFPGAQQIVSVTGGRTYRAKVWVYPEEARTYRFVIRTTDETYIGHVEAALSADSWQEMSMSVTIPDHVRSIIFRVACISNTDGHEFYLDDALLAPGFDAATLGKMLDDVRTAAIAVGSPLSWLTPTWSTTLDSDGNAWDQDRQWNVNHGQTFLQLIEYARKWNYEFRIRWDAGDSRFEWDMWNPTGGGQTRTLTITGKSGVSGSAPIVRRPPGATYLKAEGALGHWGEFASTTLDDVWGRLEKFYQDRQGVDSSELDELAERIVTRTEENTAARSVTVGDPVHLPWTDYQPGDIVTLNLAPKDVKRALRVAAIVVKQDPSDAAPQYDVHFGSPVYSDDAAMAQGLRTLLREFRRPTPTPHTDGRPENPVVALGGSAPTLVIAASNSSDSTKRRADFICFGTDDHLMFQLALQTLEAFGGGRLLVCEGLYSFGAAVVIVGNVRIEGMGTGSSLIQMASGSNANMFHLPSPYGAAFELIALDLDGNKANQSSGTPSAIQFDPNAGSGELIINNCDIHDFRGDGIVCDRPAARVVITDSIIRDNSGIGIDLFIEGSFHVSNTTVSGNGSQGIKADGAALKMVGCRINDNTSHGFNAGGVNESTAKLIVGNEFIGNGGAGLRWDGIGGQIIGNYCEDNTEDGMTIFGNHPLVIVGNTLTGNTARGVTLQNGAGGRGGVFANNVVRGNGQHGIYVDGSFWLVEGNHVFDNSRTTTNTDDGIHVASGGDDCNILCNSVREESGGNAQRYGIRLASGATNTWVAGNNVHGTFGTASYSDAGTGTINVWAGTFGDNY